MSARIATLDAFRGIACAMVIGFHYLTRYQQKYPLQEPSSLSFDYGYLGVHFFFMVSGFVIFMTLQRTDKSLDFIVSRFSRLFPTYWICIVITLVVMALGSLPEPPYSVAEIATNLSMLQSFLQVRAIDGSYWSLAYELVFYAIMWAIYAMGLLRRVMWFMVAWLTFQFAYNLAGLTTGWSSWTISTLVLTQYAHYFVAGIVFYRIFNNEQGRYDLAILAFCVVNQLLAPLGADNASFLVEKLLSIALILVFYAFARGHLSALGLRPLVYLGSISYALYLLHQNIGYVVIDYLTRIGSPFAISVIAATIVTILLAAIVTRWFEKPAIGLIRSAYRRWNLNPAAATSQQ